jgi:uncharacterized membrane protein
VGAEALLTILAMGIVTYLTRIGGHWLMGRVPLSPPLEAALAALPGALLVALLTPLIIGQSLIEAAAAALVALAAWRSRSVVVAIIVGVLAVAFLRRLAG